MAESKTCKRCGATMEPGASVQGMCTRCLMELGMEEDSHVVITGSAEAPAPPPSPEELAPLFPNHEILELLGQGGMGVVYKARQKGLDREVALKILPASASREPTFAERFAREAKALASLNHPNIVNVFDYGSAGEHYYVSLEFVDGVNLRQMLQSGQIAPKQALQIVEQICDALQYAHDEGVVHRDIKPENILIDRKGRLKITDFGLAKILGHNEGHSGLTMSHHVMGTPHYMAPEQVEHPTAVDHRADIYSLGVVFYELLTGELPLGRFKPPSGKVEVNVKLDEVVLKALEKEPGLRYQTAGAVKTDVHGMDPAAGAGGGPVGAGHGGGGHGPAVAAGAGHNRWHGGGNRRTWVWVLVVMALLMVVPSAVIAGFLLIGGLTYREAAAVAEAERDAAMVAQAVAEEQSGEAALEHFARLSVVTHDFGTPTLTDTFRTYFGIEAAQADRVKSALGAARSAYGEAEEANTTLAVAGDQHARATIEAFPGELARIEAELWTQIEALLAPDAVRVLRARDLANAELFDFGVQGAVVDIHKVDGGYSWSIAFDGEVVEETTAGDLPRELERFWRMLFAYQPPSAVSATSDFLETVAELDSPERRIEFTDLYAKGGQRRRGSERGIELRANMTFVTGDTVSATEFFQEFCEALAQRTGAAVQARSSEVLDDMSGIEINSLEVAFPALDVEIAIPEPGAETNADVYIRSVARDVGGIGELDIVSRSTAGGYLYDDVFYSVDPTDPKATYGLGVVTKFLVGLEATDGDGSTVTEVKLDKVRETGEWTFDVGLQVRRRN